MKIFSLGRIIFPFLFLSAAAAFGQQVSGVVIDQVSGEPLSGVSVTISNAVVEKTSDIEGVFVFSEGLPQGEHILTLSKNGFFSKHFPLKITSEDINLGQIPLVPNLPEMQRQTEIISLGDHELDEEQSVSNISGLLQASKDVFLNAAAFDFSPTFFRPRGYDSEYGKVLINGIEMNKIFSSRPLWSNWGGLNDVQRNQEFSNGTTPSSVSFGGPAGTTNIIMRASQYTHGGKFSYAVANRSYSGRAMGSYHSGLLASGWAYSFSVARRFAEESFVEGTIYDANSFFASVEKKINDSHSLNFTGFYTPNKRGRNSPNTQEVFELKGNSYNAYWGWQDGEIRNSRVQVVEEPVFMLNHSWTVNKVLEINTDVAYQFGKIGNSRIEYGGSRLYREGTEDIFLGGGSNPDPAYYQKLPSYFLRFTDAPNFREAYLTEQEFRSFGQINWDEFYLANGSATVAGGNAVYVLYEDRVDDRQISAASNFRYVVSSQLAITGGVDFRQLESKNFASVLDLFGAASFLDVDAFSTGSKAQNDLKNPNKLVSENDIFKYHYSFDATKGGGFLQAEFNLQKIEAYLAVETSATAYRRSGHFQNGNFPDNSLGESEKINFGSYGAKGGFTYKLNGRNYFSINLSGFTKPPALRNSFSNARQNNDVVLGLTSEKIMTADAGYQIRTPFITGKITGFYGLFEDATEVSFYYADGLSNSGRDVTNAFVQEIMTGIDKRHVGVEFGLEIPVTTTLKIRSSGSIGEYIYQSNPNIYLTSDDFTDVRHMGQTFLEGYRLSGGPQRALQAGFEYRDPAYWWISASANFFSKSFIDVAPLPRTKNFETDLDGLPLLNFDKTIAQELLQQEEFESYMLVNVVGGKSWRIKNRFLGIFASLNNILNTTYKTGGYEQSRNVNYTLLKADMERDKPLFGSKYWFGPGTTYYAHVYLRF